MSGGGDGLGLEPLANGPVDTKLHSSPRLLGCSAAPFSPLSGHNLPHPTIGTRPFPVEGRGSRGFWRAHRQMDLEPKSMVTLVVGCAQCHCPCSIQLVRGHAQAQRCGDPRCRANPRAPVVAASRVCQGEGSAEWVGIPPGQGPHPISQRHGFRRGRETRCLQSTELCHPTCRGHRFPDGVEAIALLFPGQLRGEAGVSRSSQSGYPTTMPRTMVDLRSDDRSFLTTIPPPIGYKVYMKNRDEHYNDHEATKGGEMEKKSRQ